VYEKSGLNKTYKTFKTISIPFYCVPLCSKMLNLMVPVMSVQAVIYTRVAWSDTGAEWIASPFNMCAAGRACSGAYLALRRHVEFG
jgi:hypothetical protein